MLYKTISLKGEQGMEKTVQALNHVLVRLFNDILMIEERALCTGEFKDLSVKEMHVLEAAGEAGEENNMSALAQRLRVTTGTLTVSVQTLCRKGYLVTERASTDRRVVRVRTTEKAQRANEHHARFHRQMVERVMKELSAEEQETLTHALEQLTCFFEDWEDSDA